MNSEEMFNKLGYELSENKYIIVRDLYYIRKDYNYGKIIIRISLEEKEVVKYNNGGSKPITFDEFKAIYKTLEESNQI